MATLLRFPTERVEHDTCPKCGAINGVFERLGSGICNACLARSVAAIKAAETRRKSAKRRKS